MSFGKGLFFVSLLMIVISVYFYRSLDEETQKEYLIFSTIKVSGVLRTIDSWLKLINLNGIQPFFEDYLSNYTFRNMNTSGIEVSVKQFDGVEVIMFDPVKQGRKRPAVLYVHGGGWSHLNPRFYSFLTADIARRLNTLIVSINYRKAPEHPYPAAFDDVKAAVKYFFINHAKFDVDPGRVALMGDSAGGNLVVAVAYHMSAIKKKNKNAHIPKLVVPLCPSLQTGDMMLPSLRDNVHDIVLTKQNLVMYLCQYAFGVLPSLELSDCMEMMSLNSHIDEKTVEIVRANMDWTQHLQGKGYDKRPKSHFNKKPNKFKTRLSQLAVDPGFSPLSALNDTEIKLLPPMYIFGASRDPLRDDAKILASRMIGVGNLATYKEINYYHDPFILSILGLKQSSKALDELEALFKENAIL